MNTKKCFLYFLFFASQINTALFPVKNSQEKISRVSHPLLYEQYEKAINTGQKLSNTFEYNLEKVNIQKRLIEFLQAIKKDNTAIKNIDQILVIAIVENDDEISATLCEDIIKIINTVKDKSYCHLFLSKIFEQVEKGVKYRENILRSISIKDERLPFFQKIDAPLSDPENFCDPLQKITNNKEHRALYSAEKRSIKEKEDIFENVPENRALYERGIEEEAENELIKKIVDLVI